MPTLEVAAAVVQGVEADRFWILVPGDLVMAEVERRMQAILEEADPPPAWDNWWQRR
jgi:hypothetical protein